MLNFHQNHKEYPTTKCLQDQTIMFQLQTQSIDQDKLVKDKAQKKT